MKSLNTFIQEKCSDANVTPPASTGKPIDTNPKKKAKPVSKKTVKKVVTDEDCDLRDKEEE